MDSAKSFTSKKEFLKQFGKKSRAQELWRRFFKNKTAVIGLVIFTIIVLAAVFAPLAEPARRRTAGYA